MRLPLPLLPAGLLALGGCTALPTDTVDRLDPNTAATVTVIPSPVELVAEVAGRKDDSPFAFLAPFETDRQGDRSTYIWVATFQNSDRGPVEPPKLICDNRLLNLKAVPDLAELKLSQPPYKSPAPWSPQFYFEVPREDLQCLASAQVIGVESKPADGDPQRFSASGKKLAAFQQFARR